MTPQAFSYATVGNNGMIYVPPYGLTESIDYMLKMDPNTYEITKIPLQVDDSTEKWQKGIVHRNLIYFLPYNESSILIVDTNNDNVEYVKIAAKGRGKYVQGHIYGNRIIAIPYGEHEHYDYVLDFNMTDNTYKLLKLDVPVKDTKMWHTTQMIDGVIYGLPRGENHETFFPYRLEYNCLNTDYKLVDLSDVWADYDKDRTANKKFTTLAKVGNKLFAPPYSESKFFDFLAMKTEAGWLYHKTGQQTTSRKYYAHTVARNNKIFFPPAGHDEDWSEMLVVDSNTNTWTTIDLGIGKESKKYFAGVENSQGKIYYIPRGGCVCEPEDTWKSQGDLAEVLVVDTNTNDFYTVDVKEYFKDSTTIEKYNNCVIKDDVIFAFPYGESDTFQTVLIFDTVKEQVVKTVDLNVI